MSITIIEETFQSVDCFTIQKRKITIAEVNAVDEIFPVRRGRLFNSYQLLNPSLIPAGFDNEFIVSACDFPYIANYSLITETDNTTFPFFTTLAKYRNNSPEYEFDFEQRHGNLPALQFWFTDCYLRTGTDLYNFMGTSYATNTVRISGLGAGATAKIWGNNNSRIAMLAVGLISCNCDLRTEDDIDHTWWRANNTEPLFFHIRDVGPLVTFPLFIEVNSVGIDYVFTEIYRIPDQVRK